MGRAQLRTSHGSAGKSPTEPPRLSRYESDSDEQERKPNTRKERINMTNTQNLGAIIIKLMEEEQKLKTAYEEAEEQNSRAYDRVLIWEKAYTISGEDKKVGQRLDEVYDEYSEANYAMHEAEERAEAIEEALEALRNAAEAIEWLGL